MVDEIELGQTVLWDYALSRKARTGDYENTHKPIHVSAGKMPVLWFNPIRFAGLCSVLPASS
jgi:hypothetical protein